LSDQREICNTLWFWIELKRGLHFVKIDISMTTIKRILENSKIEILQDPDFTLKSKYQRLKLRCMANKIYKNKKILYVCFEVNRKNVFNLSFCIVIVNAPKNNLNALMK